MKKMSFLILVVFFISLPTGCVSTGARKPGEVKINKGYCVLGGAALGTAIGAATNLKKPLKNAAIGGIIGLFTGAAMCEIIEAEAQKAALEAARTNQEVYRQTSSGQKIIARPVSQSAHDQCKTINNEAWDTDGTYLGKITRRICPDGRGGWQFAEMNN